MLSGRADNGAFPSVKKRHYVFVGLWTLLVVFGIASSGSLSVDLAMIFIEVRRGRDKRPLILEGVDAGM